MLCYYGVVSLYPTVNAVIFTWLGNRSCVLYQYQPLNRLDYNSRSQFACADMPRIDCRWQKADKFTRDSERERFATFIELKNAIHQSAFISITRILDDICRLSIFFFFGIRNIIAIHRWWESSMSIFIGDYWGNAQKSFSSYSRCFSIARL